MDVSLISPPLWMELTAIVAGALAGAVFAASRDLDVVGIAAISVVGGLGGGILRDLLLGTIPLALVNPVYLYTAAAAAGFGMMFRVVVDRLQLLLAIISTISLGLFTVVGSSRAFLFDLPAVSAVMVGVVTAIGGGLLIDVLVGDVPPKAFRRGAPFATAALAGSVVFIALAGWTDWPDVVIAAGSVGLVCLIRGIGVWRGWVTPGAVDITPATVRRWL
jgi:uncharacterized membrane protein YeiH